MKNLAIIGLIVLLVVGILGFVFFQQSNVGTDSGTIESMNQESQSGEEIELNEMPDSMGTTEETTGNEVQEFTILADDYGYYINGEDISSISVSQGNVAIRFNVDNDDVYYAGLDFKGCGIDTGKVNPGSSVDVEFIADSNCIITSYWPSSSVVKDRLNVVVS